MPTQNKELTRDEKIQKLGTFIKEIKMAMLTTADTDGKLRSRPMGTLTTGFDGKIRFVTREHSGKVESIQQDQHVNVAYSDIDGQKYVSVVGQASLTTDKETLAKYWNPAMKAWFPEGLEDPEIALIEIDVESAEIWDSPPNKLVQLVGMAEAIVTGKSFDELHGNQSERVELGSRH